MSLETILKQVQKPNPDSLHLFFNDATNAAMLQEEVSEERVKKVLPKVRERIAFYREYPDLFVDEIKGPNCGFKFRPVQRLFLRSVMRHRYVYCVFTRGFSKSFLAIMALILKAILFPGAQLFVTTGGKLNFC